MRNEGGAIPKRIVNKITCQRFGDHLNNSDLSVTLVTQIRVINDLLLPFPRLDLGGQ